MGFTNQASLVLSATIALAARLMAATAFAATTGDDLPKAERASLATEFTVDELAPADWFERLTALPSVRKLTVRRPDLKHFKVARLAELPQLTEFRAEDFPLQSPLAEAVAIKIAKLPGLRPVTFDRTGLTDRGLARLQDSSICELVLKGEELLTDDAFESVARMKSLRTLVLDATPIEAAGLERLQRCLQLRRFALRRHPAGSNAHGADGRLAAIAGMDQLKELEIESTEYNRLVVLKRIKSLRQLTLRRCGATESSQSLKQLSQLSKLVLDNCNTGDETFKDVKAALADVGIEVVDATSQAPLDLLTRGTAPVNEATKLARQLHDELDIAKHHPVFWIRWQSYSSDVPAMKAEPVRSIYRLKKALSEKHVRRPFSDDAIMAWAPGQFYTHNESAIDGVVNWEQIKYGDTRVAWAREKQPGKPPLHVVRNGVREFVASLFGIPCQFSISHQSYWWGVGDDYPVATSSISPKEAVYGELPAEPFAGEVCRVFESAGRSERLWISKETGRLRGSLRYEHQGYFIPFEKQGIVAQIVGYPIKSVEEYRALFGDTANALAKEKQQLLSLALAEYWFDDVIPFGLAAFSDYREIAPGRWFPFRVQSAGWLHNEQNQGRYDFHCSESVVSEVTLDRDDLRKYWADALPKKGETVQDQRHAVTVTYKFGDDPARDDEE